MRDRIRDRYGIAAGGALYYPSNTDKETEITGQFEDYRPPTKVMLSALWAATMFCYAYGDYFGLYVAGTLADWNNGRMGPLGAATPGALLAVAAMMAVPSVMVFLTLVLPPATCRWMNIILGLAYTAIMADSLPGSAPFYIALGILEIILTLTITVVAVRWLRTRERGMSA